MTRITLATLRQASAQEVFDQVARHLLTQNQRSLADDGDTCAYHNENGLMCAAGCLISDDEYSSDFEMNSWDTLAHRRDSPVPEKHMELIQDLQVVHDHRQVSRWPHVLEQVARKHKLSDEVVHTMWPTPKE